MVPAPFRVVLDANVLFPFTVRDTLLRAAALGMYQVYWSEEIDQIDALVVAVLATYSYSVEKAWELRGAMREARLCSPDAVAGQSVEDVGNRMKRAGYDRGGITYIIAPRLIGLMEALHAGTLEPLGAFVKARDEAAFVERLKRLKGFGPKSAAMAWMLMAG